MKHIGFKTIKRFFFLFFIFLIIFYFGFAFYRQHQFERIQKELYNEWIEIEEKTRKVYDERNLSWNPNDLDDRYEKDYLILGLSYSYYTIKSQEIIIEKEYEESIFLRFFEAYARHYSASNLFRYVHLARLYMGDQLYRDLSLFKKESIFKEGIPIYIRLESYISEWEDSGGKREGDWWEEFEKSEYYHKFLDETFEEIENLRGRNIERMYEEIMKTQIQENIPIKNIVIRNLISDEKELAEIVYHRYNEHKKEKDYMSGYMDSYTIHALWYELSKNNISIFTEDMSIFEIIKRLTLFPGGFAPNIYLDIFSMFLFSILASFIITIILIFYPMKR